MLVGHCAGAFDVADRLWWTAFGGDRLIPARVHCTEVSTIPREDVSLISIRHHVAELAPLAVRFDEEVDLSRTVVPAIPGSTTERAYG